MNQRRETGDESLAPTVLGCWLQAGGLVLFAVVCWVVVTIGIVIGSVVWAFGLPMRLFAKAKSGHPGSPPARG